MLQGKRINIFSEISESLIIILGALKWNEVFKKNVMKCLKFFLINAWNGLKTLRYKILPPDVCELYYCTFSSSETNFHFTFIQFEDNNPLVNEQYD